MNDKEELKLILTDTLYKRKKIDYFDSSIFLTWVGSVAYGTKCESTEDKDIAGIVLFPYESYFGLNSVYKKSTTLHVFHDNWDMSFYELREFLKHLLKSNPSILSILWTKKRHHLKLTEIGEELLENKSKFLSNEIYLPIIGCSRRLKSMRKNVYEKYMTKKRKEMVAKFGFDCIDAAHSIRYLKMGIEVFGTGKLNVHRSDRKELIQIKTGKWEFSDVYKYGEYLFEEFEQARLKSVLPEHPDRQFAEEFVKQVLTEIAINGLKNN